MGRKDRKIVQVNREIIEQYIRENNIKDIETKNSCSVQISPIDSEKKRTFLVDIDGFSIFMKLNIPFWDEENTKRKMLNEKTALEILKKRNIRSIPELYKYDSNSNLFNTEVLFMGYIFDTRTPLNRDNISKLVEIVRDIHYIKSKDFTVPFGDFTSKFKGNGYDFINSYLEVLEKDVAKIGSLYILKRLDSEDFLKSSLLLIKKKIKHNKDMFEKTREFSIIHGHLVRNKERKHVLIDKNKNIYIIDWENVCFGEKELEIAAFLYENDAISKRFKKQFIYMYNNVFCINFKKVYIYMYLLRLDDLVEEFKKTITLKKINGRLNISKNFLKSLYRQKQLLFRMQRQI